MAGAGAGGGDEALKRVLLLVDEKVAKTILNNKKTAAAVDQVIADARITTKQPAGVGSLLVKGAEAA